MIGKHLVVALGLLTPSPAALAQTWTLVPARDNTIYEPPGGTGLSNALHAGLFAGNTGVGEARRALLQFDVAGSIPAGSTITDARLVLTVTRHPIGVVVEHPFGLHRVEAAWGEGTSFSVGSGGLGTTATPGDATWDNAFEPATPWTNPGGDFVSAPSATRGAGVTNTTAAWSGSAVIGDVQGWLDGTFENHGWILIGDEGPLQTARRFGSREHPTPSRRPRLFVGYAPPGSASFCDAADGSLAACPCANAGAADSGCDIGSATGGVALEILCQQTTPTNQATMRGTGYPASGTPLSIVIRAPAQDGASPVVFGDGLRCVGVPLRRLAATLAQGGVSLHTFGHGPLAPVGTLYYQLWFADTPAAFCDATAAFNLSNGRTLAW